ncbi:MAG: glycine cleavage system protein H [Deltaproteobacteria bacterium]|nr:glycine cleavage system protein H [Deltaproteobacteria bacterium]
MEGFLEFSHDKFLFRVKEGYRYSGDDFWADVQGDVAVVGIADFLQKARGDVAFLEMAEPGVTVTAGQEAGTVETIKATFGILCPVAGTIVEVNPELEASPFLLNEDPYGAGWIYKVRLAEGERGEALLAADSYLEVMKGKVLEEANKR